MYQLIKKARVLYRAVFLLMLISYESLYGHSYTLEVIDACESSHVGMFNATKTNGDVVMGSTWQLAPGTCSVTDTSRTRSPVGSSTTLAQSSDNENPVDCLGPAHTTMSDLDEKSNDGGASPGL